MVILSDFIGLTQECVVLLLKDQPLMFVGAFFLGMVVGGGLWMGCHYWALAWNKSYKMTPVQHALACIALTLSISFTLICFSIKEIPPTVELQIQQWHETIAGDVELKDKLMQKLYSEISARGLENMSGIPDPATIENGKRWEFVYRKKDTQQLIGRVYTQGILDAFAQTHRLLFTALFQGMASDLISSDIRKKTNNSSIQAYNMENAALLVASEITEKLQSRIERSVIVIQFVLPVLLIIWMCVPIFFIALGAYRDIKVSTLQSD